MTRVLEGIDGAVATAAHGVTRRRLFRRIGAGALGLTFGTAYLWRRPDVARAASPCTGISCRSTRCYANGTCHCSSSTGRRSYAHAQCLDCVSGTSCWTNGCYRCCDCCVDYDTGSFRCTLCGFPRWACTCRGYIC